MTSWLQTVADRAALNGAAVRISILRAEGSVPREAGTSMIVTEAGIEGTIGGGALEHDAITRASSILSSLLIEAPAAWFRETRDYPLGPSLGQCCGGYVKLLFELFTRAEAAELAAAAHSMETALIAIRPLECGAPIRLLNHRKDGYADVPLQVIGVTREMLSGARPSGAVFIPASKRGSAWFIEPLEQEKTELFLYGAGHVGRALVKVIADLPFDVTWIDTSESRFPVGLAGTAVLKPLVAKDPAAIAKTAAAGAFHLVMTYSHPLDLAICHEILKLGTFAYLGLIGSATKRARFVKRLRELGHNESALSRLICPIGVPNVKGKEPAVIAIAVAAQLLEKAASAIRLVNAPIEAGGAAL